MRPACCTLLCMLAGVALTGSSVQQHPAASLQPDWMHPLARINVAGTTIRVENSIKVQVNATSLAGRRGEWVEVSWHGVNHPSYADWVGLLVPAGADPTHTAPAKYQMAAQDIDKTHITQGRGRLRFHLISYRAPMQFVFFRGGLLQPVLAARGPAITPSNPNEPLQRRLALTGDNTQMRVEWTTRDQGRSPVAKWGPTPGRYTHTAPASSRSYTARDMCGPPANSTGWGKPGVFHSVVMVGLEPGRRYYYAVGDEEFGFSPEASFVAAPPVGPSTRVKVLALADLGQAEEDGSMEADEIAHSSLNTTGRPPFAGVVGRQPPATVDTVWCQGEQHPVLLGEASNFPAASDDYYRDGFEKERLLEKIE